MDRDLRQACANPAAAIGLEVEVKEFRYLPPTPFHPDLVAAVRDAAATQGYPHQDIVSGAGHDAVYMARVAPSATAFVPCVGGISQNEDRGRQARGPDRRLQRAVERGARSSEHRVARLRSTLPAGRPSAARIAASRRSTRSRCPELMEGCYRDFSIEPDR
jgi:metal-dependent amidase/aminoacylase/carboxypeptidase family protein